MKETLPNPPRMLIRFFRWFCDPYCAEDIEGDLLERFDKRNNNNGKWSAKAHFALEILLLMRPGIIRPLFNNQKLNSLDMFKHNFILTIRNFRRYKNNFIINLLGLTTAISSVLFIWLWVNGELQTDQYHENRANLYQLRTNHPNNDGIRTEPGVPGLLLEEIQAHVPEVALAVACTDAHEFTLSQDKIAVKAPGKFASEEFFNIFTHKAVHGDLRSALSDKSDIVITAALAKRLFNTTDVIGKAMEWHFFQSSKQLVVSAVIEDLPPTTSEKFEFLMSWDYYHNDLIDFKGWGNYYGRIMVVTNPEANTTLVSEKIDQIVEEKQGRDAVDVFLANYGDQYLYNKYHNGVQSGGRIEQVNLFILVAIFILLIACINFINLSTAQAAYKTKEVGIKKTLGASRASLMSQYFIESTLLGLLSLIVAVLLVWTLLPQFNAISSKEVVFQPDYRLLLTGLALVLTVGIAAGSYPAFYLSGLRILSVLKPGVTLFKGNGIARKVLVVAQFAIAVILISGTLMVKRQMDYVQNSNLGYDRENVIYFEREGKLLQETAAFIAEMSNIPGVKAAATSGFMIGGANSTGGIGWEGKAEEDRIEFLETRCAQGSLEVLGVELLEGRLFSKDFGNESEHIIFNETAIREMGLTDPIGKTVRHYSGNKKIIGVVKDFNMKSLHTQISPAFFLFKPEQTLFVMAKIGKGTELATIKQIEEMYKSFNPDYPFQPNFLDQDYAALYQSESQVATLSSYFAALAILISCLGLFGLVTFTTQKRQKEIGIRKVLGSGVWKIIVLITMDFTKMVVLAIVIALPLSYLAGQRWLDNFAYRIQPEWWWFALVGLAALAMSWLTVSAQTLKAASINPAESLKDE